MFFFENETVFPAITMTMPYTLGGLQLSSNICVTSQSVSC